MNRQEIEQQKQRLQLEQKQFQDTLTEVQTEQGRLRLSGDSKGLASLRTKASKLTNELAEIEQALQLADIDLAKAAAEEQAAQLAAKNAQIEQVTEQFSDAVNESDSLLKAVNEQFLAVARASKELRTLNPKSPGAVSVDVQKRLWFSVFAHLGHFCQSSQELAHWCDQGKKQGHVIGLLPLAEDTKRLSKLSAFQPVAVEVLPVPEEEPEPLKEAAQKTLLP